MGCRIAVFVGAAAVALAAGAAAQDSPSRAPDGHPDVQGVWYFGSATPLERPRQFSDKPVLTAEEAAAFERQEAERIGRTATVHPPDWLDYGTDVVPDRRSSLIVDPPDGRVPPLTPEGRQRATERSARRRAAGADGPEALSVGERCLVFSAGPPIIPGPYNNNLQIVQTPDAVVLHTEMIHDARIVPLDGRPQLAESARFWTGSARGRWEGDTLVVETTHFTNQTSFRGSDETLRVIERFTLEGPDALRYEFTIDNPAVFTAPWTARQTLTRTTDRMYEFACHEGNYGLLNILKAARYADAQALSSR